MQVLIYGNYMIKISKNYNIVKIKTFSFKRATLEATEHSILYHSNPQYVIV